MTTTTVMAEVANFTATTLADAAKEILMSSSNETLDNSTTLVTTTTTATTVTFTTTAGPSITNATTLATTTTATLTSTGELISTTIAEPSAQSYHLLAIFVTAIFVATVLLIVKVVASHNNKRRIVMNWWHPNSPGRRSGPAAIYTAAGEDGRQVSSMDVPDSRFDWERQFFDEDAYNQAREYDPDRTRARLQLLNDP